MSSTRVLAGTRSVVQLRGELDITVSADLSCALQAVGRANPWVCVDLSEVAFLDASILGVLVAADLTCRALGGCLAVRNASSRQRRVFELCHLEGLFGDEAPPSQAVTPPPQAAG